MILIVLIMVLSLITVLVLVAVILAVCKVGLGHVWDMFLLFLYYNWGL
jgi:hypothetical protein